MEQHGEFTLAPLPLGVHFPLDLRRSCVNCALHRCRELFKDVSLSREQKLKYD